MKWRMVVAIAVTCCVLLGLGLPLVWVWVHWPFGADVMLPHEYELGDLMGSVIVDEVGRLIVKADITAYNTFEDYVFGIRESDGERRYFILNTWSDAIPWEFDSEQEWRAQLGERGIELKQLHKPTRLSRFGLDVIDEEQWSIKRDK